MARGSHELGSLGYQRIQLPFAIRLPGRHIAHQLRLLVNPPLNILKAWHLTLCILQVDHQLMVLLINCVHTMSPQLEVQTPWLVLTFQRVLPIENGHQFRKHLLVLLAHFSLPEVFDSTLFFVEFIPDLRILQILSSIHIRHHLLQLLLLRSLLQKLQELCAVSRLVDATGRREHGSCHF